jgi:hypothetical protein
MNTEEKRTYVLRTFASLNGGEETAVSDREEERIEKMSDVALDAWIATNRALEAVACRQRETQVMTMRHLLYVEVEIVDSE